MNILAIESSFDETAAAVIKDGTTILSHVVASSHDEHKKYGGVVPEIAAREQLTSILPILSEALQKAFPTVQPFNFFASLSHIDSLAVTVGPGLIGSLLIGVETAKTIAMVTEKPIIPVNHVLAHIYANFLCHPGQAPTQIQDLNEGSRNYTKADTDSVKIPKTQVRDDKIKFPAIALVVSGGHTELYLMESESKLKWLGGTIDDAAGEAFDKGARLLGFEHQGGPAIQKAAKQFQASSFKFQVSLPRPLLHDDTLNFSFSGLKTALLREWNKHTISSNLQPATCNPSIIFAYELQEAITDVLVKKTMKAAEQHNASSILVAGGVAANTRLREKFLSLLTTHNPPLTTYFPPIELCTDNAATIGSYAFYHNSPHNYREISASPSLSVEV